MLLIGNISISIKNYFDFHLHSDYNKYLERPIRKFDVNTFATDSLYIIARGQVKVNSIQML